jgi:hypothetical protein
VTPTASFLTCGPIAVSEWLTSTRYNSGGMNLLHGISSSNYEGKGLRTLPPVQVTL